MRNVSLCYRPLTVKYVQKPGSLTFLADITSRLGNSDPYDSPPFVNPSSFYLMSYNVVNYLAPVEGRSHYKAEDLTLASGLTTKEGVTTLEKAYGFDRHIKSDLEWEQALSAECRKLIFGEGLVDGPSDLLLIKSYVAMNHFGGAPIAYLPFTGTSQDFPRAFTMLKSGVMAICYCSYLTDQNDCQSPEFWSYGNRLMISGPIKQTLFFPTGRTVGVQLHGYGLERDHTWRIIPSVRSCTESSFNPVGSPAYRFGCPGRYPDEISCKVPHWAGSGRYRNDPQNPHRIFTLSHVPRFVLGLLRYVSSRTWDTRRGRGLLWQIGRVEWGLGVEDHVMGEH